MKARFPGLDKCLAMMRGKNPAVQEDGFHWLLPHAGQFAPQLIAEFEVEQDPGLKYWLLELIGEARDPISFELFEAQLRSQVESYRHGAIRGLHLLNTKESRRLLFEASTRELDTPEATERFRADLANITKY
jgi:hypothetical protein